MIEKTCGEALMHLLEGYGVNTVFGIPGEHTLELYRGIEASHVRHITARNEQGAGFMADGYGRVTGQPGVCTLITGPGVTNATTAIGQAYADSIPMLIVSSANDSPSLGKGWGRLHETTDLCAITAPITAFSVMVHTPSEVPELIARAFTVFNSRRPRPVHIAIPIDVMEISTEGDWSVRATPDRPVPGHAAISEAVDLLSNAKQPIIVVGGGAQEAGDGVTELAELLNMAVISSNAGKGIVPDTNPLSLTGGIISPAIQTYLSKADVVLAIGTELAEADSFIYDLPVNGKVIRVDIDSARFNDCFPATVGVQGDARAAVDMLLGELNSRGISGSHRDTLNDLEQVRDQQSADFTLVEKQHITVLNLIRHILPNDAIMMGDIAQLVYTGTQAMPVYQSRTWFYPAGYGTLGCSLPGAIGAKVALPERDVVALVGDGGFMFTIQELATAVEEEITVPIVLWNNNSYAMIRDGMRKRGYPEIGVNPRNPDFIKLADAFGCPGVPVASAREFETALREALDYKGPTIIMVMEDDGWLL